MSFSPFRISIGQRICPISLPGSEAIKYRYHGMFIGPTSFVSESGSRSCSLLNVGIIFFTVLLSCPETHSFSLRE